MTSLSAFSRRLLRIATSLVVVTLGTMALLELTPGSPGQFLAGDGAPAEVVDAVNQRYHFDDPLIVRYLRWLGNFVQGDLGVSYTMNRPVRDLIVERLNVTVELAILGIVFALLLAVPAAIATARRPGGALDKLIGTASSITIALPSFALALLLAYFLAYKWRLFPTFGWTALTEDPLQNLRGAFLPVVALAAGQAVIMMRVLRADLLETLQQDYIALARSKGVSSRMIMWKHALKPSSFSLLTLAGLTFAQMLGGALIVESIFILPGIGRLLVEAIGRKDIIVVQGLVVFVALAFLVINLLVDMLYGVLDPRTKGRS
jgi:peptide/nickel transport system permease protein